MSVGADCRRLCRGRRRVEGLPVTHFDPQIAVAESRHDREARIGEIGHDRPLVSDRRVRTQGAERSVRQEVLCQ